jgi:hypothetical protein
MSAPDRLLMKPQVLVDILWIKTPDWKYQLMQHTNAEFTQTVIPALSCMQRDYFRGPGKPIMITKPGKMWKKFEEGPV